MELHRAIQQIGRGVFGFDVLQLIAGANATADKAVAAHVLAVNQSLDQALVQRVADLLEIWMKVLSSQQKNLRTLNQRSFGSVLPG